MNWTPETLIEITDLGLAAVVPEEIRYAPTDAGSAHIRCNNDFLDTLITMCQAPELTYDEAMREQMAEDPNNPDNPFDYPRPDCGFVPDNN